MGTVHLILSACANLVFNELSEDTVLEGITFGLTDGWWMFVDAEIRSSFPLMRPPAWQMLFASLHLQMIAYTPEVGALDQQAVLLARKYMPKRLGYRSGY
jgi:hypothetical protein